MHTQARQKEIEMSRTCDLYFLDKVLLKAYSFGKQKVSKQNITVRHTSTAAKWKRVGPKLRGQWVETISC